MVAYGQDPFTAVAGPRLHHQLVPDALFAESWAAGGIEFVYSDTTLAVGGSYGAAAAAGPMGCGAAGSAVRC